MSNKAFIQAILSLLFGGFTTFLPLAAQSVAPTNLKCEYKQNPLGIETLRPRLSWQLGDNTRGERQTAYQIQVATNRAFLGSGQPDMWDSGPVSSAQSHLVPYAGPELQARTRYFWQVRYQDQTGKWSRYSAIQFWETNWLGPWPGTWIGKRLEGQDRLEFRGDWMGRKNGADSLVLTRTFELPEGNVSWAVGRIGAKVPFILWLNGKKIAERKSPAAHADLYLRTRVKAGENRFRLCLAPGENQFAVLDAEIFLDGMTGLRYQSDESWKQERPQGEAIKWYPYGEEPLGSLPAARTLPPTTSFVKTFQAKEKPVSARLYLTGLGGYVPYCNGSRIGTQEFTPGWSHYPKRIFYQTYGLDSLVEAGVNEVVVPLGNLWWSSGLGWRSKSRYSDGPLRMKAAIVLRYQDGSEDIFPSDSSWRYLPSGEFRNSLYGGEYYHRVFNDYVEEPIDTFSASAALLSENPAPPIRVTRTLKPLRSWQPRPGLVRYDFGENIVGRMRLFPQGPAGRRYSLRFAEILHPDSSLNVDPLRSARSTDVYISLDTYPESWAPSFTYHGFRYAEVAVDEADSTSWEVIAEVMHNDVALKGTFSCGDSLLNEVYAATYRSLLGNLHSVPTDCPQRDERLGWMGDAQAFAPSANYAYEMTSFWKKWTQDMRDGQDSSGYVYDVNPPIVVRGPAKPGWGDAMTIIPWNAYVYAGDTAILADNYEAMSAWVAYMYARRKDHLYIFEDARGGQGFGDWVSVEPSDKALISAAFYARSTDLLARTAKILGKTTEARRLELRLDTIRQAFFQRFWAGKIESPASQTERLLTVAFGLCPGYESDMMTHLSKEITEQGHLTTGFLGTPFLLPLLSQFGYHELAWKIATRTEYPSWGYMLEQGATTIWEQWDVDKKGPQQGSRNHFALGPVGEWMYGSLAGIQPLEAHPGFQTFRLAPKIPEDLAWAKAAHESPYGLIVSGWHKFDGGIFWQLRIPPNSQAEVTFPAGFDTWQEGETFWWKDHVVQAGAYGSAWEEGEQGLRVILPAGTYSFKGM